MEVAFGDEDLDRLEVDPEYSMGLPEAVVKAYRKRLQLIRAALDERDFRGLKSLHYEKLRGDLDGHRSMRLNDQYRLILEICETETEKIVRILAVTDYH